VIEFFAALNDPDTAFLWYAMVMGLLSSVAFGIVGTYVVVRRISYLAGAIAHCALGGIGLSLYLQHKVGMNWFDPLLGALASSLLAALLIGFVTLYAREREDTVIGALWAIGMAVGLLFLAQTPETVDPMSYLFGNIMLITGRDLWLVAGLDVVVVVLGIIYYHQLEAMCFDEEFARLRGVRVERLYLLLLCLIALTVILLISMVGIVMVIALLTLPAAVAGKFTRHLWQMMVLSVILSAIFIGAGLGFSYTWDFPSGPTIILLTGIIYLLVTLGAGLTLKKGSRV